MEVSAALEREVAPAVRLVGTVRPQLRTTVAAEVAGLVTAFPADEGAFVRKGDLLCKLRDAPRRFAHDEAVAGLSGMDAALAVRQAELDKATFERDRTERLWNMQRSTDKERNDAQAEFEAAKGRVEQAKFAVEAQKAVVERLADDLARTEIRAPYDGFVTAKRTEIGSWVDDGGAIVELLDLSTVRVRVNVPEAYIAFCDVGAETYVTVEALDRNFPGRVSRVIPNADQQARTFPVDVDIPNPENHLKAGMFVRAMVPSGPKAMRLLIPKDAVVRRGPVPMVFVVRSSEQGQMAEALPIEILSEVLDYVAVKQQGLSAGDQVIVRGNEFMQGPGPVITTPRPENPIVEPDHSAQGRRAGGDAQSHLAQTPDSDQDG